MEVQVKETVYCLFGISSILEAIDEEIVRPLNHLRYGNGAYDTRAVPKMIFIEGQPACGKRAICSALVNELRRGGSNKRGDVHYKNRDVKYLEWNNRNTSTADLTRIFTEAQNDEFTVVVMPSFETVCPSPNLNRVIIGPVDARPGIKASLIEQLNAMQPGKMLVVAISTQATSCDEEVMSKVDYRYELSTPDAEVREEIILGILEYENAELKPPGLIGKLVHATRNCSIGEIVYVVNGALNQARGRLREMLENGSRQEGALAVTSRDWTRYLDIVLDERVAQDANLDSDDDGEYEDADDEEDDDDDEEEEEEEEEEMFADGDGELEAGEMNELNENHDNDDVALLRALDLHPIRFPNQANMWEIEEDENDEIGEEELEQEE